MDGSVRTFCVLRQPKCCWRAFSRPPILTVPSVNTNSAVRRLRGVGAVATGLRALAIALRDRAPALRTVPDHRQYLPGKRVRRASSPLPAVAVANQSAWSEHPAQHGGDLHWRPDTAASCRDAARIERGGNARNFSSLREALKDAGDELRMPHAASQRGHLALRQLGRDAPQRQTLLLQIPEDRCQVHGAGHCLRLVYLLARSAPVAPSRTPRCFAAANAA